jgi:four helix bundle protein
MTEEEMKQRTKKFAVEVVRRVEALPCGQAGAVLGKQLIRCATSVGANYRSACRGRSKLDFISRLAIAEEECDEAQYWLELLHELNLLDGGSFRALYQEAEELTKIFAASGRTAKMGIGKSQVSTQIQIPKSQIPNG